MPAGAKVPDSTAIVLYHFNDVWTLYPGAFNMAPCKVKPDLATGAPLALSYPHFYMVCIYKKLIQVYNLFQHFQDDISLVRRIPGI